MCVSKESTTGVASLQGVLSRSAEGMGNGQIAHEAYLTFVCLDMNARLRQHTSNSDSLQTEDCQTLHHSVPTRCRSGCYGSATSSYPATLPLLHLLPKVRHDCKPPLTRRHTVAVLCALQSASFVNNTRLCLRHLVAHDSLPCCTSNALTLLLSGGCITPCGNAKRSYGLYTEALTMTTPTTAAWCKACSLL